MPKAQDLVDAALRKLMVTAPSATQRANGITELNNLLAVWFTQGILVYQIRTLNVELVSGDGEYTIGPGGNFNTERPRKIASAFLSDGRKQYPLVLIDKTDSDSSWKTDFDKIDDKTESRLPTMLYYDPDYPDNDQLGKITFDSYPDKVYGLHLDAWVRFLSVSTLESIVNLPSEYNFVLTYNLAIGLAPELNQRVSPEVALRAEQGMAWMVSMNTEAPPVQFDPMLTWELYR